MLHLLSTLRAFTYEFIKEYFSQSISNKITGCVREEGFEIRGMREGGRGNKSNGTRVLETEMVIGRREGRDEKETI